MNIKYLFLILILILYSCQSVSKKIDENVQKEERELSKLLNSSEDELKIEMGNPDRIIFKEGNRNRFYVYKSEKFKIKCERIFEIDQNNSVIGFTSKTVFEAFICGVYNSANKVDLFNINKFFFSLFPV